MKGFFKILLKLLGAAIALVLIAILVILFVVDPNDYKEQIAGLVENVTGRTLTIEGDIKLTFYPWLGLDLGKVSLDNAPGFEKSEFAKIVQTQVQVKLVPLLNKQLEVGTILLEGASLTLTRKPDGTNNWNDLAALGGEPEAAKDSKTIEKLTLNGIDLRNSKIVWDDQQADSRYVLSDANLRTSALLLNEPIKFSFNSDFEIIGATQLRGQLALDSQVTLNQAEQQYRLEPLQLIALVQGDHIPEGTLSINTQLVEVDLKQQTVTLDGIIAEIMDAILSGELLVQQFQTNPELTGRVKLTNLNLQKWIKLYFKSPPTGHSAENPLARLKPLFEQTPGLAGLETQFEANFADISLKNLRLSVDNNQFKTPQINLDIEKKSLDLKAFSLRVLNINVDGQFNAQQIFSSKPSASGQLAFAPFNLRKLLKQLELLQLLSAIPLPDEKLLPLKTAALKTEFHVQKANKVNLKNVQLRLDDKQFNTPQFTLNFEKETLDSGAFSLQALDMHLQGKINVKQLFQKPTVWGKLTFAPFNLRKLLKQLEQLQLLSAIPLPDEKLLPLKMAALKTEFHVQKANKVNLKNLHLRLDDKQFNTPQFTLNLERETLDSGAFSLQALDMRLQGKINVKQLFQKPTVWGKLTLAAFNPQQVLLTLGQAPIQLPAPFTLTHAALQTHLNITPQNLTLRDLQIVVDDNQLDSQQVNFNFAQDTLTFNQLVFKVLGTTLNGDLSVEHVSNQPLLQGAIKIAKFNPRLVLQRLGQTVPKTTDPTVLKAFALETQLQGDFSQLNLDNLKISLDNSQLQGNIKIQNFQKPAIAFNLKLDKIDIDRYFPPKSKAEPKPLSGEEIILPLGILRALNLNGDLKVEQLKTANLKINDIHFDVSTQNEHIKLTPFALDLKNKGLANVAHLLSSDGGQEKDFAHPTKKPDIKLRAHSYNVPKTSLMEWQHLQ
ncbi:MAG: hypothetical protein DRQ49_01705 [Gammaproteobacteria bacterium]|nr:MAG: hypothetical protein DRQ49_01705 [Gammaproteobacteria bacterium]